MSEETRITFKNEGGLEISKGNTIITTGKVIVNGIEITSVEDWTKVTQSIVELQQENNQLKDRINKAIEYIKKHTEDSQLKIYGISDCKIFKGSIEELLEILGDKNENRR